MTMINKYVLKVRKFNKNKDIERIKHTVKDLDRIY